MLWSRNEHKSPSESEGFLFWEGGRRWGNTLGIRLPDHLGTEGLGQQHRNLKRRKDDELRSEGKQQKGK